MRSFGNIAVNLTHIRTYISVCNMFCWNSTYITNQESQTADNVWLSSLKIGREADSFLPYNK